MYSRPLTVIAPEMVKVPLAVPAGMWIVASSSLTGQVQSVWPSWETPSQVSRANDEGAVGNVLTVCPGTGSELRPDSHSWKPAIRSAPSEM